MVRIKKNLSVLSVALLLTAYSVSCFAEEALVAGFDDLPLMDGLVMYEEGMRFDTPEGRIISANAVSSLSSGLTADGIEKFYKQSLVQLGWKYSGKGVYTRDDEILKIETTAEDGKINVGFNLEPNKK